MMRPSTPTLMVICPAATEHCRAARTNVPSYFSDMAALSPLPLMVSVEAPWRISMYGHSISGVAPATGCDALSDDWAKKLPISPRSHGVPEDDEPAAASGADAVLLNRPPPLQPETTSAKASAPAGAARPHQCPER